MLAQQQCVWDPFARRSSTSRTLQSQCFAVWHHAEATDVEGPVRLPFLP